MQMYSEQATQASRPPSLHFQLFQLYYSFLQSTKIENASNKTHVNLAVQAFQKDPKLSVYSIIKIYNILQTIF